MNSFEECKKQVADKHGFRDWNRLIIFSDGLPDLYYTEAAELYARHKTNEAVKEDREDIIKKEGIMTDLGDFEREWYLNHDAVRNRPLPYPDEK
ncbi:hypothetical protein [Dyadobacter sp. OTU695]|uniref:hypothetical protein n=1 Tax=Dyadobacter sp. OTU695 TaxID=3043860 RepID=UPI00313E8EF6